MHKTTSSKTGTDPPTSPVLPPWGQTAIRLALQKAKICDTSSVVFGFKMQLESPKILIDDVND